MKADVKKVQALMKQTMTTEKDLIAETGVSAPEIKNVLAGKSVDAETMVRIANSIGVSVEKIVAAAPAPCYRLYFRGKPYSSTKYDALEDAKRDAEDANECFSPCFGRVYVCDWWGNQVA